MVSAKKFGFFRGRFQPFHSAHLEICLDILDSHEVLVIGIVAVKRDVSFPELATWGEDSAKKSIVESFRSDKNPFLYFEIAEMIRGSLIERGIPQERFLVVPHFPALVYPQNLELFFAPPKEETIVYIPQKGDHNIHGVKTYSDRGWTVRPVKSADTGVSATMLRQQIGEGSAFLSNVPPFVASWLVANRISERLSACAKRPNTTASHATTEETNRT